MVFFASFRLIRGLISFQFEFYTCADFHRGDETIEEAQQNKADFILKLIDPQSIKYMREVWAVC